MSLRVPFTRLSVSDQELEYVSAAIRSQELAGDGVFARRCEQWLVNEIGCRAALLTHSGTAALEMAALLSGVGPGDEVILPSFTFSSTANAFVLRGATPVFVDIEPDTFNLDPDCVAEAMTPRTRVVVPVHYAGVPCDMARIGPLASRAGAMVIEDAAQALCSTLEGRPLGSFGSMAALSFHQTKNVTSGEGGAILLNEDSLLSRAEIIREKGTNRRAFHRGVVDKYTWIDLGSSYVPSELIAAFLLAQLERARSLTARRHSVWRLYHEGLAALEEQGLLRRPRQMGNAHIYSILLSSAGMRDRVMRSLHERGISAVFHYVPLHSSPAGKRFGRAVGRLSVTDSVSARLLRLPIWNEMPRATVGLVVDTLTETLEREKGAEER